MKSFFTYIDFGEKANKFLKRCGVGKQPSSIDIAELLVRSSREVWNLIGNYENYLTILLRINYDEIVKHKPGLIESMKEATILAAVTHVGKEAKYRLALAEEIFIDDDAAYQEVFKPWTAPNHDGLKDLYKVRFLLCHILVNDIKIILFYFFFSFLEFGM